MIAPSSNDDTVDNPLKDEGAVEVLMRLTKTVRLLQSTDYHRNPESRLISITKTNRPKTEASSILSGSVIGSCFDELIDGEKRASRRNSNASKGLTLVTQEKKSVTT
ncbi:MAG: hypothetical protein ACHRXM_01475 [Isosphaerales bacterium]